MIIPKQEIHKLLDDFLDKLNAKYEEGDIVAIYGIEVAVAVERKNPNFERCLWDKRLAGRKDCYECPYKEECDKGEYIVDTVSIALPLERLKEVEA